MMMFAKLERMMLEDDLGRRYGHTRFWKSNVKVNGESYLRYLPRSFGSALSHHQQHIASMLDSIFIWPRLTSFDFFDIF
jgi:hypothetical protein